MTASNYRKIETKDVGRAVQAIQEAFTKKRVLERTIAELIQKFEDETGLAIDVVRYQRDITIPVRAPHYTDLSIVITTEQRIFDA